MKWIKVEDKLPVHGQHVLVFDLKDNVFPFPRGHKGDNGNGNISIGDAIFFDKKCEWDEMDADYQSNWKNFNQYLSMNGPRERWSGHGPCSFDEVTHWMPLPDPPEK